MDKDTNSGTAMVLRRTQFEVAADVIRAHPAFGPGSCSTIDECYSRDELVEDLMDMVDPTVRTEFGLDPRPLLVVEELIVHFATEQIFWEREGLQFLVARGL